jgi:hypothetical protein
VHERGLPEVDVADALQREALERAVGADEVLDERVGGAHEQLGRRGVLRQVAALLEHRDLVAHLDRLVDVVGDEDDRLADLGLQAQELVLQALAVIGSIAPNGSSMSRTGGSAARARATPTRWRWPPESCAG